MVKAQIADSSKVIIEFLINNGIGSKIHDGVQWLIGRVHDATEGPRVKASPASLRCVHEQVTLILA